MSSIDKRIVQMQFDNQGFEKGVSTTMNSLKRLNESLKMKGADNGLSNVQNGINKLTSLGMGALSSGVDVVSGRFNALGIVAATALMNITNQAIATGKRITNALTIQPIMDGFNEYETKMNAIQTILTNTESKGTTIDDVKVALAELNDYADKTIYNFADMTKNIGTFTAAGVDLDRSVTAIKGIANLAAGSGSSALQASTAMYQLSQALAAGKVGLQDWNSVVNAGMGGDLFKNALIDMAKQMGIFVDESKPFRETLQDGWLTSEVLIKTLEKFANDESLVKAATQVKTFTQLIDTMKESVGSGWATTWEYIIGDKDQATEFFTAVSEGFNSIIEPSTQARNAMFKAWNNNGGRAIVIEGLTNAVQGLGKVLGAIGDAWNEVFPPMTSMKLMDLSNKFRDLTEKFKISDETAEKIKTTFKGLFEIIPLVGNAITSVINGIKPLGKLFEGIGPKILDASSKLGEFISGLRESASEVGFFETISSGLSTAFEGLANFILGLKDQVKTMMTYISELDFSPFFDSIGNGFEAVYNWLKPIFENIGEVIGSVNMDTFYNMLKGGIAIQVVGMLKGVFDEIKGVGESATGFIDSLSEITTNISDTLNSVKDALASYQRDLNASTLLKMAGAIAILAGSLLLISSIDGERLAVGLGGLTVAIAELVGAFILMEKLDVLGGGGIKISAFFIAFSTSVFILSSALKKLSELSPEQLMTGIIGLTTTMLLAVSAVKLMGKDNGKIISSATGLLIFSAALHVMASALEKFGEMDPEVLGSGLSSIGMLLAELALFMVGAKFGGLGITSATGVLILSAALLVLKEAVEGFGNMDPDTIIKGLAGIAGILAEIALFSKFGGGGFNLIAVGAGLAIIANAIESLSNSLTSFSGMSWEEIGKGLAAMAGGLLILGVASKTMSGLDLAVVGVGIGVMSASLLLLTAALKSMGNMTWEEIGKGMLVLAGSLTILAVAMYAMSGTLLGAAALVVAAGALAVLTPQLLMLSQMSLEGIGIALLAMAGAFTVLGLAGLLLTPVVPTLLALSGVIVLIGIGAVACGAGLTMIGAGLAAIGVAVGASGLLIVEFLKQLINLLPMVGVKLAEAFVNFVGVIVAATPQIVSGVAHIITQLLIALNTLIPMIVEVAMNIIVEFAEELAEGVPKLVDAGLELIEGVLRGIADNIQGIVEAGADCVINFMDGIANKLPEIIESGINLALSFIEGVADGLTNNKERMASAIEDLIHAVLTTGVEVIKGGVTGFIEGGKELLQGAIDGIKEKWPDIVSAVEGAIESAKQAAADLGSSLWQAGVDLIQGFINGIGSMGMSVVEKATEIAGGAVEAVKNFLGINSPSRVFKEIGKFTVEGMVVGLDKYAYMAEESASGLASGVLDNVRNPLKNVSKILNDEIDVNPKITPVIDLSNVTEGSKLLSNMLADQDMQINARSGSIAGSVGKIQNRYDNSDIITALKDLKDNLNTGGPSYTVNGVTYDDGSNIVNAVESLVRAARIERRI